MTTLKQKFISGTIWTVTERLSLQILQLIVSIILSRLLGPSEYGLIGMLTIFIALSQSVIDSGFGSALIQKKDADQIDTSSIFFLNIIIGFILTITLILTAPLIANFYNQPELINITRVLSLNLIINSFGLVQTALLSKSMDFKAQMKASLIAASTSGLIGIALAYNGFGVWSLVIQMVLNYFIRVILIWNVSRWRPSLVFSSASIKSMFPFGSRMLLTGLVDTFFLNIYNAFIGKIYSSTTLGFYTRATVFVNAAVLATSLSIEKVTYSALAPYQDEISTLKQAYRKTIRFSVFLHFPLMVSLIVLADPMIRFLLTDKWAQSIPYFQLLCVSGIFYPLQLLNLNILKVKGRSDLVLKLGIIQKLMVILAIFITFRYGIMFLIYGQIITSIFSFFIYSFYSGRMIMYSQINQLKDLLPFMVMAIIMGSSMFLFDFIYLPNPFFQLLIKPVIGVVIYCILNYLAKTTELIEFKKIISNMVERYKS
jgi:O-antigen/teichoic acid export membrane protein